MVASHSRRTYSSSISLIAASLATIVGRAIAALSSLYPRASDPQADCKHAAARMTKTEIANRHIKEAAYSVAEDHLRFDTPEGWKKTGDKHKAEEEKFAKKRVKYQDASQSPSEAAQVHREIEADRKAAELESNQNTRETMEQVTNEGHPASGERMIQKVRVDKKL